MGVEKEHERAAYFFENGIAYYRKLDFQSARENFQKAFDLYKKSGNIDSMLEAEEMLRRTEDILKIFKAVTEGVAL